MLSSPKSADRTERPSNDDKRKAGKKDASAEFIQELAESGTASELGTVNAAADAVEGKEDKAVRQRPGKEGETDKDGEDRDGE